MKNILKNISLSTYKEQKRSENAKDWEKNLKILALYLLHCKKELVLLHPDEKNLKYEIASGLCPSIRLLIINILK
jgi:hypothetical protein